MPKAIVVTETGGPESLRWEDVPERRPIAREVLIRQVAVGVNYIDIYHRSGVYPLPHLPFTPGLEAAGEVEAVGPEVIGLRPGDRVVYARGSVGAYAQKRILEEMDLLRIPEGIGYEHAAASLLRGLTAQFLLRRVIVLQEGMTILVHAAAGGVGLLLCQWAASLGVQVIGMVSNQEKAALAGQHGCAETIISGEDDVIGRVRVLTKGRMCNVVYDSVGKATFDLSLDCLMRFGLMVSYGNASGRPAPVDPALLMQKGSLFLTRPSLNDYTADLGDYQRGAVEFYERVLDGTIRINVGQSYYLSDAASAHRDLEARKTTGATVMLVD